MIVNIYSSSLTAGGSCLWTAAMKMSQGGRRPYNVARRMKDEGKSGFPFGLVGDMVVKYSNNDAYEIKENESLDVVNLLTFLGEDIPKQKKFCSQNCSFQHTGTPVLFLDDPGELTSEERCSVTKGPAKQVDELCQVSTSLISSSLWHESDSRVMSYIPHKCSDDHSWRIEHELGFRLPSVMGECVEQLIEEVWMKVKDGRCDKVLDSTLDFDYLVADAQVKLARFLQLYLQRRSEPTASERCALTDEKFLAREIFGRHHSDIGGMSSESEDEFINGVTTAPAITKCIHVTTTSEASNTEK